MRRQSPFCEKSDEFQLERVRFAVLKLSGGDLEKLRKAVKLAQTDWRDVLMAAGFGHDVNAHKSWSPYRPLGPVRTLPISTTNRELGTFGLTECYRVSYNPHMNRVFEPDESLSELPWPSAFGFGWPRNLRRFMFYCFAFTLVLPKRFLRWSPICRTTVAGTGIRP